MIQPNEFDETLRRFIRSDPFIPFYVELDDGKRVLIRHPGVAFGGGGATTIDPVEGTFVDFDHEHVVGFTSLAKEAGA